MIKACQSFFKRSRITRFVCMLLLVFCFASLTGCSSETAPNNDGASASKYEQRTRGCWLCPVFGRMYDIISRAANDIVPDVARSSVGIVGIGYGLWLAIFILKHVSSVKEPDFSEFWKTFAAQAFWVIMIAALLFSLADGTTGSAITDFAEPVFTGFVEAGMAILQGIGSEISCSVSDARSALLCLVNEMHQKLSVGIVISLFGISAGPSASVVITAIIVCVISIELMVYLPITLIDCVFRYGIALCMLPLAVAAYPFKSTRDLTGKVAKMFVEVGFTTMGLAAFAACCAMILQNYLEQHAAFLKAENVVNYMGTPDKLEQDLNSPGLMGLLFISFFLMLFAEVVADFIKELSGGAGGIGKVAHGAVSTVKNGGKKIMQGAKKAGNFIANRRARRKDKRAWKLMNKKPKDSWSKERKEYFAARQEMARKRLQQRGYFARGLDGKMHATAALDKLTKNEQMKGPFKGIRRAINNVQDLRSDWNKSSLDQDMERRGDRSKVSEYDQTYGTKGKSADEIKAMTAKGGARDQLDKWGGLQGAGEEREVSSDKNDSSKTTPKGITEHQIKKGDETYETYSGFTNSLEIPDYKK